MKILLGFTVALAAPAIAFAHLFGGGFPGFGHPAPAPELAAGLPAAVATVGAVIATRFKRR